MVSALEPASSAIDVTSPVPSECWRALRAWLEAMDLEFEPNLHADVGLVGYSLRLRNYLVGISLTLRSTGPVLSVSAVLCRGMDREHAALGAVDRANRQLTLGQVLYLPGPPAELSFFAASSMDLLDGQVFPAFFDAILSELNGVGFPAVMAVRGYHPGDYAAPWGDEPLLACLEDSDGCRQRDEQPCSPECGDDREASVPPAPGAASTPAASQEECPSCSKPLEGEPETPAAPAAADPAPRRKRRR